MKKNYSKKQIQEAIKHWQGKLNEMRLDDDEPEQIYYSNGEWHCYNFHGKFFESIFKRAKTLDVPIMATIDDQDVIIYNPVA